MRPALITGISGFIGGHLWALLGKHDDVIGVHGKSGKVPFRPELQYPVELTRLETLAQTIRDLAPRCIIHLAAISSTQVCRENALQAWRVNHAAVRELTKTAEEVKARVILASSDQVFSGVRGNYREGDRPDPVNIYGETKKAAERSLFAVITNGVVVRINNTYGPLKFRGSPSFSEWILTRYQQHETIPLFRDQYRSPIDVITLTHALVELIDHSFRGILHLGGYNRLSRVQFGRLLLESLGKKTSSIIELKSADKDPEGTMPQDTSFDISLAKQILKTPFPRIQEALALVYEFNKSYSS